MVKFSTLGLAAATLAWASELSLAFTPKSSNNRFVTKVSALELSSSNASPEFKVLDEDEDVDAPSEVGQVTGDFGDHFVVNNREPASPAATTVSNKPKQKPEYGALSPGTVVQVQVGDVSLARKAWKKRRRTGSPLLIPCSILNVDRQSMVRWNLIYLLEKFGRSHKEGVEISETQLSKRYRTFLKSSLQVCLSIEQDLHLMCVR
jgi:hypothetical protein